MDSVEFGKREQIKKENVWSSIVEPDTEDDRDEPSGEEQESQVCEATKTDGKPCQGIKYKDTQYCYNHLMALQTRPRGRPKTKKEEVKEVVVVAPVMCEARTAVPVCPIVMEQVKAPSRVPSPKSASCSLVEKLSQRLKEKVEVLDDEMIVLLKMLL